MAIGLYHWTIGTFLMDHSAALVNRAMDYSFAEAMDYSFAEAMDYSIGL